MSSQDEREQVVKCLGAGAIDYLIKPLRRNELRHIWTRLWWSQQAVSPVPSGAAGGRPAQEQERLPRLDLEAAGAESHAHLAPAQANTKAPSSIDLQMAEGQLDDSNSDGSSSEW